MRVRIPSGGATETSADPDAAAVARLQHCRLDDAMCAGHSFKTGAIEAQHGACPSKPRCSVRERKYLAGGSQIRQIVGCKHAKIRPVEAAQTLSRFEPHRPARFLLDTLEFVANLKLGEGNL